MRSILEMLYPPALRQRLRPGSELERLLQRPDERSAQRSQAAERILAYAEQQDWLDHPTRQRLASGDDIVMLAALNELAVAYFLAQRGAALEPNPPGRGRHVGEFLVTIDGRSFFLEVKTLVAPLQDSYRSAAEWAIAEAAGGVPIPAILEIELQSCPNSGVSIRDLRYYLEQSAEQLLAGGHEPPAYIHRSGLALRVLGATAQPEPADQLLQVRFIDWQNPDQESPAANRRRERLLRALRGAYDQLPAPAKPSLVVVVNDCDANGDNLQQLLAALSSGFLRPSQHRRLSAVGYYCPLAFAQESSELLTIVHNPWATQPLALRNLCIPQIQQVCLLPRDASAP